MKNYLVILILLFSVLSSKAQKDSIYFDKEIIIKESQLRQSQTGSQVVNWDANGINDIQKQSLANLLSSTGNIYIKTYGPGILSTSSLRGGQSGHTLVLWNGLPIQSPLVGQLDFSLLNLGNVDELTISRGGQSSMWGSGAIGGVISLDNIPSAENTLNASVSAGAFGLRETSLSTHYNIDKISFKTRVNHRSTNNDFTFKTGSKLKTQTNARQQQTDINQDVYFNINNTTRLSLHYWGILAERQIPPTVNQSFSDAHQKDDIHRTSLALMHSAKKKVFKLSLAYFDEALLYEEASQNQSSLTGFRTAMADLSIEERLNSKLSWIAGFNIINNSIKKSPNYPENTNEQRIAIFLGTGWQSGNLQLNISIRQELLDAKVLDPLPSLAAEYKLNSKFLFNAKLSRNFKYPSLNDRYWVPGGNSELKSEIGWSMETGVEYLFDHDGVSGNLSLTGFNRTINNWIQWSLNTENRLWSAFNLNEVWSRGIELRTHIEKSVNKNNFIFNSGFDYIKSTSQKTITVPNIQKGEQLWYTPELSGFAGIQVDFSRTSIQYFHKWTSQTKGINAMLTDYDTGLFYTAYKWALPHCSLKSWISISNIWNKSYRVIEFRPMPGRHLVVGLVLNFKKHKQ